MRRTGHTVAIARALLSADGPVWGYDLIQRTGIPSGRLYPLLAQMIEQGWLIPGDANTPTLQTHRPPRRYYRLSKDGDAALRDLVESDG